ncbi:MAG: hypothetical protein Ct9H90mP5_11840 [Acidimicrobiaceae bacterium]|nr:MAG: hypothetical protein Ct9H90mP5_11840 [Acidimicrobiaceae bacterium]
MTMSKRKIKVGAAQLGPINLAIHAKKLFRD